MAPPAPLTTRVACIGDVLLDVLVEAPAGLVADDDTEARITTAAGGQAANVACWVSALGGRAVVVGPRAQDTAGSLAEAALAEHGVRLVGPRVARSGTVVSIVHAGRRSLASDPGDRAWLDFSDLDFSDLDLSGCDLSGVDLPAPEAPGPDRGATALDWVVVSGYALLRTPEPDALLAAVAGVRVIGTRVAVDLASASLVCAAGPGRARALWRALEPSVVVATDAEWAATHSDLGPDAPTMRAADLPAVVLKHGADGATFHRGDRADVRRPLPGERLDATGAGDALLAGYLLGGPDLAMHAAAQCLSRVGAQPRRDPEVLR